MSGEARLKVVLCWHMHQPQYRDLVSGRYAQPWTYLHAIKDYVDMAAHIEAVPAARAVINVVPILFEQLADYAGRSMAI
jgi:alpha-amylase/alpha-mannosidase (GH57 family)